MKRETVTFVAAALIGGSAAAESQITALCGDAHVNEAAHILDVTENPDGFYIQSLQTQISHGDPRLVYATGTAFNFCTRSVATPDMDASMISALGNERRVRFLFVPMACPSKSPTS